MITSLALNDLEARMFSDGHNFSLQVGTDPSVSYDIRDSGTFPTKTASFYRNSSEVHFHHTGHPATVHPVTKIFLEKIDKYTNLKHLHGKSSAEKISS